MTTTAVARRYDIGETTTRDGASIRFRSLGKGPGLVLLHGAMQSGLSQYELATLLGDVATVHLVDRRGRGLSDPYASASYGPPGSCTDQEVDDLVAVLERTGARTVLGVSTGALIALRAALAVPAIDRLVLFEPPLLLQEPDPEPFLRHAEERSAGDLPASMVTGMLLAEMGPGLMRRLPRPVLLRLTRSMLAKDERRAEVERPRVRQLAEVLDRDLAVVQEQAGTLAHFAAVRAETLLLHGTRTRPYLKAAVTALAATVPCARNVSLPRLNHAATQDKAEWGRPAKVAPAILAFLGG